jgi:hypothetical protein
MRSSSESARRSADDARRRAPRIMRLGVALGVAAWSAATAEPGRVQGALDLERLMHYFATSRGLEAEFREEKSLPLLAAPIVSEGVIYFAPPDRMARFAHAPERSSLLVTGDRLRIEDSLGVEEIDLAAQPTARQFVSQLLLLFRGDLDALRRDYELSFEGDAQAWQLRLVSRSVRVRQLIREVVMRGRADRLDVMEIHGADGELTRTTYGRVATDRPFRDDELARLFPAVGRPQSLPAGKQAP